jgi:hypothetical protein
LESRASGNADLRSHIEREKLGIFRAITTNN